ncbi:fibronectin-binding protein FbpA [Gottschalkia acidurici 9a]|uniref:Rqc2 homolog RqcH n=1 Tax=Gottschalkia acidurici (strain ATCC 7906 / DSM 604 / BCRC 14475 / CIP 104303 / KCTC 5404 / NCIMB 10678 / 9a) TaxID=1128398 RepID=K0AZK4_GOTA9|nr:NFACT RNA binding domain-containing protein [Gottschalkia acidurici]AFS78699.1 fibronectin-binding protein FbpA [Gottschalkia acidurici 9a]
MALDGIVLKNICAELKSTLIEGKIDKVHQPENDEIFLSIRSKGQNIKLLISASSNNPRIYITDFSKQNPSNPPMFCMLLRKHLQGGKIVDIEQVSLERIIKISIQSLSELGDLTIKELIVEIMGKHSNIILVDRDSGKIIDSIKRIPLSVSSIRQVLPGLNYSLPPSQNKLYPIDITKQEFFNLIDSSSNNPAVYKFLYSNFIGLSPLVAKEICFLSNIDDNVKLDFLSNEDKENLFNNFNSIYNLVKNNKYNPVIIKDKSDYEVIEFSSLNLMQFGDLPKNYFDSVSKLLDYFYLTRDKIDRIKQKSNDLRKSISIKLERALNKLSKQKQELLDAEKREKFKIYGELLTANIYRLEKGLEEVELENFYSEDLEPVKIRLDKNRTPSQNAQRYYKKYNKLKNAHEVVSEQLLKTKEEVNYLENILLALDTSTEVEELDEIREELVSEGYIRKSSSKVKKSNKDASSPHHYISKDGFNIYVGKNNKQNDYLTLKFASKEDIWLHTKDIPGSHVIIKSEGKDIPEDTLLEAALLAGFYSKGKMSSNVPIDYAERKHVRKPSGAKPGMVIYDTNNTVYITPSIENISKIKKLD